MVDDADGGELARAVAAVKEAGCEVGGREYKRVPRGYDAGHERADLLLYDGLYCWTERAVPREAHTPRFPAFCVDDYTRMRPLVAALARVTG